MSSLLLGEAKSSSSRPQAPAGNHTAICVQVIDLGTHKGDFEGKPKMNRKVRISWELPDERAVFNEEKGEQPFMVNKTYNFSISDKATFRKDLESWRGRAFTDEELKSFDVARLLGVGCMVNVVLNERGYSDVKTVNPLPKQLKDLMKKPENPLVFYSIKDGRNEAFKALPDFMQKMCNECLEWVEEDKTEPDTQPPFDTDNSGSDEPF